MSEKQLFHCDPNLKRILQKHLDKEMFEYAERHLQSFWNLCQNEFDERATHTDQQGQPKLIKYDRYGNDCSYVWLNEGYKQTVKQTYNTGIVGYVHKPIPELGRRGNYVYSYAQGYLLSQVEPGFYCPVTLTMATAYLLEHYADEALKQKYLPHVLSTGEVELYEGATFLTERQGGSDVGANETKAVKDGEAYKLYGEKYFASNAGACGVATVLARIEGAEKGTKGLSLFLVPWKKEDGTLNDLSIRRLKDKLGVRAVPSAEVVLEGATAYLIGEASKGFYYMMEALNLSRVCNAIASIGIMKRAYDEAKAYADQRNAFGKKLTDYPMIQETLVELAVKQEVQTSACFELISLFDHVMKEPNESSKEEKALNRLFIALLKMRTAEEAIHFSHEAIEIHGGNGYIEDFVTPRLLRDAQVLTVWEGTANTLGLEILRLLHKYNIQHLFNEHIEKMLNTLSNDWRTEINQIKDQMMKLTELVHHVLKQNKEIQTYYAKKMANQMCDIYLCAVALCNAAAGGEREKAIAKLCLRFTWGHSLIHDDLLPLTYFKAIVLQERNRMLHT
ncbi:acyl-CoA dehydrogenase family protein [Metabacillus iocasae]|uniref:Alkylation response protein AidB-like acyl-CoA dehydrogenase n=1 Tax=Priestia iocasae TaxID=2291674 RepID=A0ABS2QV66_9BACI|nr:acyl-CoA dehydrogenase family protein [Metabacillus iocasae]MBM7703295.1 alkylation response protein AidB-like acyl-CoA dehydrogenase [Metabacillus iocasae]